MKADVEVPNGNGDSTRRLPTIDVPARWTVAPLRDVADVALGKTPGKADYVNDGTLKIIKYRDLNDDGSIDWGNASKGFVNPARAPSLNLRSLRESDVLVSASAHSSEIIGRKVLLTKQVPERFKGTFLCGEILRVRCESPTAPALANFLHYFLKSAKGYKSIQAKVHGVHLIASRAEEIPVPIAPASEQDRIVSKIDQLFSRIDEGEQALQRVAKLVERYRQSVLKAAVTGELTRDWREARKRAGESVESGEALLARILKARRAAWEKAELARLKAKGKIPTDDRWKQKYREPAQPDTAGGLPYLPEGWTWATLPQLGEFGRGKSKHRPRNDPKLYGGKYPFLQTGTVRSSNGRIRSFDSNYNERGLAQSKLWPKGTVCITIAANIAESGILDFDACFPDSIVGFVPADGVIGEYVEFFIRTARESLDRYAPATAQKNINLEILEQVAVPLPPFHEQQLVFSRAEEELSRIAEVEHSLLGEAIRSKALRHSILKAAFSGQLVPQDPHDEPASKLLERIAAERASISTPRRKQTKKTA